MKKILLGLLFLFILPLTVKGLEPNYIVDGLYIDAFVQDNGNLLVKEQIVLDGAFNGYIRDLYYKGDYHLYDASNIELIAICELKSLDDIENNIVKCFAKVSQGYNGDSHVYEETIYDDHLTLKMYNYNPSGKKIFYLEYLLKNVIVIHEEIAELYWTFIGKGFDDRIKNVEISVTLPDDSNELRGWAHGPLYGDITLNDKRGVIVTINDLLANELVDVRMVFDKELIPLGIKFSSKKELDNILKEEIKRADEANKLRVRSKFIHYSIVIVNNLWVIGLILIFIYTYLRYDKEYSSYFDLEYHREFPAEYGPEIVEYLMKKNISTASLSASILNIIEKKAFTIREDQTKRGKKEYVLINNEKQDHLLTEQEKYIKEWLLKEYGDGNEVSLKDITNASKKQKTARKFIQQYDKWLTMVKEKANEQQFFEDNLNSKIKLSLYGILGILLFVLTLSLEIITSTLPFLIIGSIIFLIYLLTLSKRTKKGNDHFVKWKAFRKFLLDFGRFDEKELPAIALWEKYLVYATVFGIANKVRKAMEIKIKDMNLEQQNYPMFTYFHMHHVFAHNLVKTIDNTKILSHSTIARTNMSSGHGFGGGFSGGGGFGGGGTGGGGRGF